MKKSSLIWCTALLVVQGLTGCNCVNSGCCKADGACQSPGAYLQKAWETVTRPDLASKSAAPNDKKETIQKANRVNAKNDRPDAKTSDSLEEKHVVTKAPARVSPGAKKPLAIGLPRIVETEGQPTPTSIASIAQISNKGSTPILVRGEETNPMPAPMPTADGKSGTVVLKNTYIKYGASPDYKVIVGRVHEWNQTLRLRYAPVEQLEAHGGSVALEGSANLQQLRDGQHVRVRGTLIPAPDRASSARYRVESVEVID